MAGDGLFVPSGSGGLMRYNEEYSSKLRLSPTKVTIIIGTIIITMAVIKIFF